MRDAAEFLNAPDPAARALVRESPVICEPGLPLRDAARKMVESGASSILVRIDGEVLGILTDHDLRTRVVAAGLALETPVREVVTTPVVTAREGQPASELTLLMLEHGVRHLPVLSMTDELLGVLTDVDLVAAQRRAPFVLRRSIANATSGEELRSAARGLTSTVVEMHKGGFAPMQISQVISVVCEALMQRMIELAVEENGPPPTEFAWLSLGSHGRREAVPSSDVDSGMTWERDERDAAAYMHDVAAQVDELLVTAGFRKDSRGVTASGSVMTHPAEEWRRTIEAWFDEPTEAKLMATSILLDGRTIRGPTDAFGIFSAIRGARYRDRMVRLLLRIALVHRPPTGFLRDLVVEHSGEHRGRLSIKDGGLIPIIGVAGYAGLVAECRSTSTVARLEAAGAAGVLAESDAATLAEAYRLMVALRMDHQVRQLQAREDPDDYLDPKAFDPLTRRYLREAFRLVTTTQKKLATELEWSG